MKIERPCATTKPCSVSKIFDTMSFFMMPHVFTGWQQRKSQKKFLSHPDTSQHCCGKTVDDNMALYCECCFRNYKQS